MFLIKKENYWYSKKEIVGNLLIVSKDVLTNIKNGTSLKWKVNM